MCVCVRVRRGGGVQGSRLFIRGAGREGVGVACVGKQDECVRMCTCVRVRKPDEAYA